MDFNKPQKRNEDENNKENNKLETNKKPILSDDELFDLYINEDITHIVEIPLFPNDFYHYQGGKRITDDEINQWIEECVLYLEHEQDELVATANSGDAKVLVMRVFDQKDLYHYVIEVYRDRHTIEIAPMEM